MISNLRISVAELAVWALLAAAGLTWISLRALDGAAWLMDWLRDRVTPLLEDDPFVLCDGCRNRDHCDGAEETCDCTCGWDEDWAEPLPPERTWEQMTSHQLPVEPPTGPLSVNRERIAPLLGSRQATAHFRRLEKARQRRFMVVSAEIWRAYAAAGLEGTGFTRAMAARVRELTP